MSKISTSKLQFERSTCRLHLQIWSILNKIPKTKKERQAGTCTLLSMMSLEKGLFSQARHILAFLSRYHMVLSSF